MSKAVSDLTALLRTMETGHDHIFVPVDLAHEALACLRALQEHASSKHYDRD